MENYIISGFLLWTLILLFIAYLNWNGRIHFGLGLGDVFMFIIILVVILIVGIFTVIRIKNEFAGCFNTADLITYSGATLFLTYILLKMTFWRGSESPWNGKIFFE